MRRRIASLFATALCICTVAAVAFAQQHVGPPDGRPPITVPRPTIAPPPGGTIAPLPTLDPGAGLAGGGGSVPLSSLPPLPPQTAANTVTPASMHFRRPQAATGGTIGVTTGCASAVGDLFPVGCSVNWRESGLPNSTYQDKYVLPNTGTAVNQSGTYVNNAGASHALTLTAGVTIFGVFDVTNNKWAAVVYVTAGTPYIIKVYQDPYFTEESYQFDASSSNDAFIHITNLSSSDLYTLSIEQTSVGPNCAFSAPAESPAPAANALCNALNSTGATAPGGEFNVTWPIDGSYPAGTYSVILFDRTMGQRLGQVQVSLTGSSGNTLSLSTSVVGANITTPPSPATAGAGGNRNVFAWDDATEQSVSGVTVGAAAIPAGNYEWSFNDPIGHTTGAAAAGISGISSHTFAFGASGVQSPGDYPARQFSAALYNTTTKAIFASQAFRLLGYNSSTFFHTSSDLSALQVPAGGSTVSTLKLLNSSDSNYGASNGDPFAGIAFTTGNDFAATAGQGNGVEMALSGFTLAQCARSAGGCSTSVTDSAGVLWTVRDYCSDVTANTTSECYVVALPASAGGSLASGAYINIPGVTFYGATGYTCTACTGSTSELPLDGVQWSRIDAPEAWNPVYFNNGSAAISGTAHLSLIGAITPSGRFTAGLPTLHLYPSRFGQALYHTNSPYVVTSAYSNIIGLTIHNTSTTATITQIALAQPGPFASNYTLQNVGVDSTSSANWSLSVGCNGLSNAYLCLTGRSGHKIAAGASETIGIDENTTPTSYPYTDWIVLSQAPFSFAIPADGTANVPVSSPSLVVDTLAEAAYSLDSSYMSASFSPGSAGTGGISAETVTVQNTSMSADPFPDYVDEIVIEMPNTLSLSGNPTTSTTGWSYLGTRANGSFTDFYFGVCAGQFVAGATPPATVPLTAVATAVPQCTNAQESNSLSPGSSFSGLLNLQNLNTAGNYTFTMWAHGADGNAWSASKNFTLPVTTVSASAGFSNAGTYGAPPAVATNTVPTIGGNSSPTFGNSYKYTIKNTSQATAITTAAITVPGLDVNSVNATDSSGNFWKITAAPTLSYSGGATLCSITSYTNATAAGANGSINIGGVGCSIAAGQTMTVSFSAIGPQSQNDEYAWPTTINAGAATAGETWLGDSRIKVVLSIGLNVVVNPSNPGPGGSTPSISCPGCSFSGSTADFGTVGSSSTAAFLDTVRASVYITSATTVNWTLSVSTNVNPANSTGTPTNELQTSVDGANSTQGAGIVVDQAAYAVVPLAGSLQVAHGASVTSRTLPYDVLQNFKISMGTESVTANIATLTYTLVAN
ncbi:MAG TPA: hypothetical protein VIG46_02090 [Candidatus Baltobacteraceae bacterium]|jgi:hypothetical protein